MPGYLLDQSSTVQCMHVGQASPTVPNPRVKVSGQATLQQTNPWTISGCVYQPGPTKIPCVTAQWTTGTTRVQSGNQPLLISDSQATCIPNGTGVIILVTQTRVKAQ